MDKAALLTRLRNQIADIEGTAHHENVSKGEDFNRFTEPLNCGNKKSYFSQDISEPCIKDSTLKDESLIQKSDSQNDPLPPEDQCRLLMKKIEQLVCRREYASKELERRFTREGYQEEAICKAISRAVECGLVSDIRYAEVLVRSRLSQGKGRAGIERELENLLIPYRDFEMVSQMLNECSDDDEHERALNLLTQKPPRSKNAREAAFRKLVSKGFSVSVASCAAKEWYVQQCAQ